MFEFRFSKLRLRKKRNMRQKVQLDFSGQTIYVGLDVHHKSWKAHIYSDEFELKSMRRDVGVDSLISYLTNHYQGAHFELAYEAGYSGFWIQRAFSAKGVNCRIVHAADVPTTGREKLHKSDKVDSRKIARGLRSGELNFIHVPDQDLELDRSLLRSREQLVKDSTRVKNRIKAILKLQGIMIPESYQEGRWTRKFIVWLNELDLGSVSGNLALRTNIKELCFLDEQKKELSSAIKTLSGSQRYKNNVALLCTIPSIGVLSAMILLTELGSMDRFRRFDELCSYCGLVPGSHASGETEKVGAMTRRGNSLVKKVLIESSWVAVRKDPALLLYYKQQLGRMKAQKVIIKIARKLLSRIRYVLVNQKEYVLGVAG